MNQTGILIGILLTFLSISLFGFLLMGVMEHDEREPCPFSVVGSVLCPETGAVISVLHHVSMLDSFSAISPNGILSAMLVLLLLFSLAALFMFSRLPSAQDKIRPDATAFKYYKRSYNEVSIPFLRILMWIKSAKGLSSDLSSNKARIFMPV